MPQLNRNHSLFGYLEVPSLPRSAGLTRPYDDPFNSSPRGIYISMMTECSLRSISMQTISLCLYLSSLSQSFLNKSH